MTDDLGPQQEEAVRRLLADARETGPVPPEVAARLDAVVADLARPAPLRPSLVRRRWPRVAMVAAAVTVAGLAATQLVGGGGDRAGEGAGSEAGATADAGPDRIGPEVAGPEVAKDRATLREAAPPDGTVATRNDARAGAGGQGKSGGADRPSLALRGLDRALRAEGLAPVGRLREAPSSLLFSAAELDDVGSSRFAGYAGWDCGPLYAVPDGSTYTSTARSGRLVVAHPPANGIRLVEVYDCRGAEPRRSTTVVTLPVER